MNSSPYLDIPLVDYEDNKAKNIDKIFNEYIYFNINTICGEKNYKIEDNWLVNWYIKKYQILEIPLILSVKINNND